MEEIFLLLLFGEITMQHKVFLDLEGVLIDDWNNRNIHFKTKKQLTSFFERVGSNKCNIFSYAIDDMQDYVAFMKFANNLELAFNIDIDDVLTVVEIMDVTNSTGIMWEFKMEGKRNGFISYVSQITKNTNQLISFYLLDDNVENEIVQISPEVTVQFIKVL